MRSGLVKLPELIEALQMAKQQMQAVEMTTMQLTERLALSALYTPPPCLTPLGGPSWHGQGQSGGCGHRLSR